MTPAAAALLPNALLQRIAALRLITPGEAAAGTGERRTRRPGTGLEFIGLRPFRPSDDPRALDARATARAGRPTLREFAADERLAVTLLRDDSPSMATAPGRPLLATRLSALLGALALAGGDSLAIHSGAQSARFTGAQNTPALLRWLTVATTPRKPPPPTSFAEALRQLSATLTGPGLIIAISDWQDPGALPLLKPLLDPPGRSLLALRLPAPAEDLPPLGPATLVDAETGQQITLDITPALRDAYMAAAQNQIATLQSIARQSGGALLSVAGGEDALAQTLRALGRNGLISD